MNSRVPDWIAAEHHREEELRNETGKVGGLINKEFIQHILWVQKSGLNLIRSEEVSVVRSGFVINVKKAIKR